MTIRQSRFLLAAAVTLAVAVPAHAQTSAQTAAALRSAQKTYVGTVVQVDQVNRLVTTRATDGQTSTFEAPPSLPTAQLAGFRAGDLVTVTYYEGLAVRRKPAGEAAYDSGIDPVTAQRTATATISAVDPASGTLVFVGPRGRYTRLVLDGTDLAPLRSVSAGDRADVTYYEYVQSITTGGSPTTSQVTPPPAPVPLPPAEPDGLRQRLAYFILWGWDNQFSGKVINARSGTYNGATIDFDQTTYDEVFGRMGLFKGGVGYRLSPRSELTMAFVWSSSASEPVVVGTIGAANTQVAAVFDNYTYWGIEVGQRFLFPRGRVTPFAGYYVGMNRFTHMNADFYAVGNQGLINVQDGQFFDSSWAGSFGGNGGVLFPLNPKVDLMAQAELRFMGGLSDVDPLSVAGLKDINDESSRWSIPFLFGARFRF